MITGNVNADLEATVPLMVAGSGARHRQVRAVIDTGFTGYLTLPPDAIDALQLTWLGREQGILADGSVELFDVFCAVLLWDGHPRNIEVQVVDAEPLVGMALLEGRSLEIHVVRGGAVAIKPLP